jgi:hypothetical protein
LAEKVQSDEPAVYVSSPLSSATEIAMTSKIASLVTEDGQWLPVQKRTAALIAEIYKRQDKIESYSSGQVEIIIDFKNSSVRTSVREIAEPKKIE